MQSTIGFFKRFPFAMLLCVQLLSVLSYGFMTDSKASHLIFNSFGLIVPILAVWTVYKSPATNWIGFVLVTASITTLLLAIWGEQTQLLIWSHAFESLLYFYAATSLVMYMFKDDIVTLDELYAAAATFTLLLDIAAEMVRFTRNQIMVQAGTAMLAQANQVPQSVLQLLR